MSDNNLHVADDMMVSLDYTLRLNDGDVIDSSDGDPLAFIQGQGRIIPGLEQALYGMGVGEEKDVVVEPASGYGKRDPDAVETLDREVFPPQMELSPGMAIPLRDERGRRFTGYVVEVAPEAVVLDFNHPLAGETLHFHVKVAGLRQATSEELAPACATGCAGCGSGGCH